MPACSHFAAIICGSHARKIWTSHHIMMGGVTVTAIAPGKLSLVEIFGGATLAPYKNPFVQKT
jgi:hypothetical protein